jgi:hypothetical protein
MMKFIVWLLLAFLWAAWLIFFIEGAQFAYAFTHSFWSAVLPGSPVGLNAEEQLDWAEAVALLWGTPLVFGILTWLSVRRWRGAKRNTFNA